MAEARRPENASREYTQPKGKARAVQKIQDNLPRFSTVKMAWFAGLGVTAPGHAGVALRAGRGGGGERHAHAVDPSPETLVPEPQFIQDGAKTLPKSCFSSTLCTLVHRAHY